MDELMTARSLTTRPVVTLGGDAIAHVRDTLFDAEARWITGFTLTGRRLLSGPLPHALPWPSVHALGHDAVMLRDALGLIPEDALTGHRGSLRARVLGARMLTEAGEAIGTVADVVVEGGTSGRIVGFRIAADQRLVPGRSGHRRRVYVARGPSLTVAGRTLVLPEETVRHLADDLAGLTALTRGVRGPGGGGGTDTGPGAPP
ncbi:PRC-barrel domain-containing protein [Streptomyces tagetis]|uniref:PRC-barrel domain containing protein n=1 Tax=Streptomyces tagetis TaxID=2820809 RepID=A0A940XGA5_9ACTN|nr:PRC-barrel domain-containing protein [Streptomyces sp. RG38]MBQ0826912.1 PRC-barrel domain containing protein [Streptomyces sp. RG38]